jgi:hypothetical protein
MHRQLAIFLLCFSCLHPLAGQGLAWHAGLGGGILSLRLVNGFPPEFRPGPLASAELGASRPIGGRWHWAASLRGQAGSAAASSYLGEHRFRLIHASLGLHLRREGRAAYVQAGIQPSFLASEDTRIAYAAGGVYEGPGMPLRWRADLAENIHFLPGAELGFFLGSPRQGPGRWVLAVEYLRYARIFYGQYYYQPLDLALAPSMLQLKLIRRMRGK